MISDKYLRESCLEVILPDSSVIYQDREGQRISSDNEHLNGYLIEQYSSFSEMNLSLLELGSGCGINAFMIKKSFPNYSIKGIEFDDEQVGLSKYNNELQKLDIEFKQADLKTFESCGYDIIISNPPYRKLGSGRLSSSSKRNLARFEVECTMSDVIESVKRNLKPNGVAYLLYPIDRECEFVKESQKRLLHIIDKVYFDKVLIIGVKNV
ncbi:MAG: hypothetical protein B6226_03595 [Candidatus Cloacimonetes bacterium 4572_65]|nr:MAG: hypothetical protein B6226_03595 [Candidatus Cloacimonetes bacterium 4572_65]